MRLQVYLSHSRLCSRRKALELVKDGSVTVNGKVILEPSYDVNVNSDNVYLGKREVKPKENSYLILNKPPGVVTTLDDKYAKVKVIDLLPHQYRHLYPVGRLDKDSEGLLIFTNDGDLTFRLLHPRFKVDKVYYVKIRGRISREDISRLEKGVFIEGRKTYPARIDRVRLGANESSFNITLNEGRKRQIRLMLLSLGYRVFCLRRIQYGPIKLGNLKAGGYRILKEQEVSILKASCGVY